MIDLKAARQEPDRYRAALARRSAGEDFDALLAADARWREVTERSESLRAEQKRSSKGRPPGPDQLAELRRRVGVPVARAVGLRPEVSELAVRCCSARADSHGAAGSSSLKPGTPRGSRPIRGGESSRRS